MDAALRQPLEAAALELQLARARRLGAGVSHDDLIVGSREQIQARITELTRESQDIVSMQQRAATLDRFVRGHDKNVELVSRGVTMMTFYETRNLPEDVLEFIAGSDQVIYHCGYVPVQAKILDRARVMLDGPLLDGRATVMLTADRGVLESALRYAGKVRSCALPAAEFLERQRDTRTRTSPVDAVLTDRQRLVAELLDTGATDEQIAKALSLSVRTIRTEVGRIMTMLEAGNRFSAGRRYGELTDQASGH